MTESTNIRKGRLAFFWDESFLWGLMAHKVFSKLSINFDIVTSEDIRNGILNAYDVIFVPGGWAGDKSSALGMEGREKIKDFIRKGGSYLGLCGGAGLALDSKDGLSIIPACRKPSSERLPNFSGKIRVTPSDINYPMWKGLSEPVSFYAWWPGQFSIAEGGNITIIAIYYKPESDFFVSDLLVEDINDWDKWERSYGINMNPSRLEGEPAIIETVYGKGKVFLSYLHIETPDDDQGNQALLNICNYLMREKPTEVYPQFAVGADFISAQKGAYKMPPYDVHKKNLDNFYVNTTISSILKELEISAENFITFGQRNFLWYWRNSWLLQWRRGIRGLEYCTIYMMIEELSRIMDRLEKRGISKGQSNKDEGLTEKMVLLKDLCLAFFEEAKGLLMEERYAMSYGLLNFEKTDNHKIQQLRGKLFSSSKRFGGNFKQILDKLDEILLPMLKLSSQNPVFSIP